MSLKGLPPLAPFRPRLLDALGRQHNRGQIDRAYERIRAAGFASVRRFNAAFLGNYRLQPGALSCAFSIGQEGEWVVARLSLAIPSAAVGERSPAS